MHWKYMKAKDHMMMQVSGHVLPNHYFESNGVCDIGVAQFDALEHVSSDSFASEGTLDHS